jgi:hypothetical protein
LLPLVVIGQEHRFDILLMNKKIGTTTIKKVLENGGERYHLWSQTVAKVMFIKQESEINFDVFFKEGHLVSSLYKIVKDGENLETKVTRSAQQYQVVGTKGNRVFSASVPMSSVHLYFKEPAGVSKVFIERLGDFVNLVKKSAGEYEYVLPDGIRNIYRYKDGKLFELEVKRGAGSVYLRPSAS